MTKRKTDIDFYFEHLVEYALTGKIPKRRKKKTVKLLDTGHKNQMDAEVDSKRDQKSHSSA